MKRLSYNTGHYYHLYNRGRSRLPIFHESSDYLFALTRIKEYGRKYDLMLIAYCLLPNHYHLLVRQDGLARAGLLPQRVFNSYSKTYNKKYQHSGTLFEGPFKAVEAANDPYLLHLCRYIHANPVVHGLVQRLEEWPYSNYQEWIERRRGSLVDIAFVRDHFPTPASYERFVREYLEDVERSAGHGEVE